jgi:site-specific recombinase XerD
MERTITEDKIEAFKIWLKEYPQVNDVTVVKYVSVIKRVQDYMNGREMTRESLEEYKTWLVEKKKYKKNSANSFLYAINNFCQAMGWEDIILKVYPLEPTALNTGEKYVARQDYEKLVTTAMRRGDYRMAMIMQTLCHADLRFSELNHLTVEAVRKGYVTVIRRKRERQIEMPDYLREALKSYAEQKKISEGIIFRTMNGKMLDRTNAYANIKKLCELADVDTEKVQMVKFKMPRMHDYYPFYEIGEV